MQLYESAPRFVLAVVLRARPALLDHWNPGPGREPAHGGGEIDVFVIHHEPENAPADPAAEAVKRLSHRVDVKRGRLLLVKRTEGAEIGPGPLEREIGADHFHDVIRSSDLFDDVVRDGPHVFARDECGTLPD